jgi:hypothetical protein
MTDGKTIAHVRVRDGHISCGTCGNDKCSSCDGLLGNGFIHVYWHEDICASCQGPPLTVEELEIAPEKEDLSEKITDVTNAARAWASPDAGGNEYDRLMKAVIALERLKL